MPHVFFLASLTRGRRSHSACSSSRRTRSGCTAELGKWNASPLRPVAEICGYLHTARHNRGRTCFEMAQDLRDVVFPKAMQSDARVLDHRAAEFALPLRCPVRLVGTADASEPRCLRWRFDLIASADRVQTTYIARVGRCFSVPCASTQSKTFENVSK